MTEFILLEASGLFALILLLRWASASRRLPLMPLLVAGGLIIGPATDLFRPDSVFGDLFPPIFDAAIAFLLFEAAGRISLKDLRSLEPAGRKLAFSGWFLSLVLTTICGTLVFHLSFAQSALLAALVSATGTTLFAPRRNRTGPRGELGVIAYWEESTIDILGTLAVIVLASLQPENYSVTMILAARNVFQGFVLGIGTGLLLGLGFLVLRKRGGLPDTLLRPVLTVALVSSYAAGNLLAPGGGLLSVVSLGLFLSNQRFVDPRAFLFVRGSTRTLLVSFLVISLVARLDSNIVTSWSSRDLLFVMLLIFCVRPLVVLASTFRSDLSLREKLSCAFFARRGGLVLALVPLFAQQTSLFWGVESERFVGHVAFAGIAIIIWYNAIAPVLARALHMDDQSPSGVLVVGAHAWARDIARELMASSIRVLVVDTNQLNVLAARREGIPARCGNVLLDRSLEDITADGFGYLLALTSNDEVNTLAALHFADIFGRDRVFQLSLDSAVAFDEEELGEPVYGRFHTPRLFGKNVTFPYLESRITSGATVRTVEVKHQVDILGMREYFGENTIPLLAIRKNGELLVFTTDKWPMVLPEQKLVCLVDPVAESDKQKDRGGKVVHLRRFQSV